MSTADEIKIAMIEEMTSWLGGPILDWAPRVMLVFLLLVQPWRQEQTRPLATIIGGVYAVTIMAGLLSATLVHSTAFWFIITALHFAWLLQAYSVADNHRYLEGYWCLAITICLATRGVGGERDIVNAAMGLGALCFALAVLAKLSSPRYRDGSFFVYTLLFDPRFSFLARNLASVDPHVVDQAGGRHWKLILGKSIVEKISIPKRLYKTAVFLTWWTIGIELIVAVLFALPFDSLERWRILVVMLFAITTFTLVPVVSFGQILLVILMVTVSNPYERLYILLLAMLLVVLHSLFGRTQELAVRGVMVAKQFLTGAKAIWKAMES